MGTLRPAQVLDQQVGLLARLDDAVYVDLCDQNLGAGTSSRSAEQLRSAATFHVAADMTVLAEYAARHLDDEDAFMPEILPTAAGFAYFEEPLTMHWDTESVKIRYLQWGVGTVPVPDGGEELGGVWITQWFDVNDNDEWADYKSTFLGQVFPYAQRFFPWQASVDMLTRLGASSEVHPSITALAFLMLLDQTVTQTSESPVSRVQGKRAGRQRVVSPRITVVQLRRHSGSRMAGESLVEWTKRWPVRGHWRRQPYKAQDGSIFTRKIWIAPYIKGPADKPIVTSDKVYRIAQ